MPKFNPEAAPDTDFRDKNAVEASGMWEIQAMCRLGNAIPAHLQAHGLRAGVYEAWLPQAEFRSGYRNARSEVIYGNR